MVVIFITCLLLLDEINQQTLSRRFKDKMAIPGVTTLIRDRFYSISRQETPTGPKIVAIAKRGETATDSSRVQDLDIVQATTEKDVIDVFGEASDLHKAFLELVASGAQRIFLVPLPADTEFSDTAGTISSDSYGESSAELLSAAFAAAESVLPDIIVPWGRGGNSSDWDGTATPNADTFGFHADNSTTLNNSWVKKIGEKVKEISENTHPCIAVLGIAPYDSSSNESMTPAQVSTHLAMGNLISKELSGIKDYGPYVVVIAAEMKPTGYVSKDGVDFGYSNGASATASAISRLSSYSAITNKPAYNVQSLRYVPTRTLQETLAGKGVNALVLNFNKIAVFGDGVTFANATSDFLRLSTKRIVDEAANLVRQATNKFVGEASTVQMRNSMETAISSALRGMQLLGAVLESDFNVTYIPNENKAIVDLILTPAFELKSIQVQIAINV
jgi:hypothetical protein